MIGLLIAVLCLVVIGISGFFAYKNKKSKVKKSKVLSIIPLCLVVAMTFVLLIVPFSIRTVKAGEIAVVKFLGEA